MHSSTGQSDLLSAQKARGEAEISKVLQGDRGMKPRFFEIQDRRKGHIHAHTHAHTAKLQRREGSERLTRMCRFFSDVSLR